MKNLLLILLSLFACSCAIGREQLTPDLRAAWDELAAHEQTLEAELEAVPAVDRPAVEQKLAEVRAGFAEIEKRALTNAVGPVVGGIAAATGPLGATLYPLVMGLVPLLGKRGRRHYGNALKNLAPWVPDENGQKGIAPGDAALDILRALGVLHSKPDAA
jgi:hypothetical protein